METEVLEPSVKIPDDGDFPDIGVLRVGRGGMSVVLGLNVLMVAALEFWMPESIEESVEAVMRSLPPRHSKEPAIYSQVTFPNSGKYAWD